MPAQGACCCKVFLASLLCIAAVLTLVSSSLYLQHLIVFLHPVSYINPLFVDFEQPLESKRTVAEHQSHPLDIFAPTLRVYYPGLDRNLYSQDLTQSNRVRFTSKVDPGIQVNLGLWVLERTREHDSSGNTYNIFYSHGNAENRGSAHYRYDAFARVLNKAGVNGKIFTYDYRGFGDSVADRYGYDSDPEECLAEDARQVLKFTGIDPSKTILFGHSLGTVVTVRLALELAELGTPPAAIVLEAPVSNSVDVCSQWLGGILFADLIEPLKNICSAAIMIGLRSLDRLSSGKITSPVYILHGTNDLTIPYELGQATYRSCLDGVVAPNGSCRHGDNSESCDSGLDSIDRCSLITFADASHVDIFLPSASRVSTSGLTAEDHLETIIQELQDKM